MSLNWVDIIGYIIIVILAFYLIFWFVDSISKSRVMKKIIKKLRS